MKGSEGGKDPNKVTSQQRIVSQSNSTATDMLYKDVMLVWLNNLLWQIDCMKEEIQFISYEWERFLMEESKILCVFYFYHFFYCLSQMKQL